MRGEQYRVMKENGYEAVKGITNGFEINNQIARMEGVELRAGASRPDTGMYEFQYYLAGVDVKVLVGDAGTFLGIRGERSANESVISKISKETKLCLDCI